jgi:hypothetical protein
MRTMTDDEWYGFLTAADRVDAEEFGTRRIATGRCVAVVLERLEHTVELGAALEAEGLGWMTSPAQGAVRCAGHPFYRDGVVVMFTRVAAPADAPYVNDDDDDEED